MAAVAAPVKPGTSRSYLRLDPHFVTRTDHGGGWVVTGVPALVREELALHEAHLSGDLHEVPVEIERMRDVTEDYSLPAIVHADELERPAAKHPREMESPVTKPFLPQQRLRAGLRKFRDLCSRRSPVQVGWAAPTAWPRDGPFQDVGPRPGVGVECLFVDSRARPDTRSCDTHRREIRGVTPGMTTRSVQRAMLPATRASRKAPRLREESVA